ncbi:MAG: YihY/virulence factor BrkB family protein [Actinomycetota bacterium]
MSNLVSQAKLRVERARSRWAAVDIAIATYKRFSADEGGVRAAAFTYYIFFSIFPLLLFAASALGFLTFGNPELKQDLIREGLKAVPLLRDALSPDGLRMIEEQRGTLALTALVMALYAGSGAVVALEHSLNKMYRVEDEPGWLNRRLRSLKWLGVLGLATLASLAFSALAAYTQQIVGDGSPIVSALAIAGGLAISLMIFATAFRFLPAKKLSWSEVLPGAALAAAAFEALKFVGSAYLAQGEAARNDTFGTFAAAAALLVSAYLIAQLTLMAAEFNAVLAERRMTRQSSMAELEKEAS